MFNYSGNVFEQLQSQYIAREEDISRIVAGVNELHQKGQMSSQETGWNIVRTLYNKLGIAHDGYLGGEVILAPFDIETLSQIPKTI